MSPQDFRRMMLAWELVPQNGGRPDDQETRPDPDCAGSPPADPSGSPEITPAILRERPRDA